MADLAATTGEYAPRTEPSFGRQLLAIYFGSPTCASCVRPAFIAAIRRAAVLMQRQAIEQDLTMHWAGVAIHWNAAEGIAYLGQLGPFDEVSSGAKWWHTAVAQHLYRQTPPAVPTLVIYERTIDVDYVSEALQLCGQRELLRLTGSNVIEAWVAKGAPVDLVSKAT
jgi:hypothetical protein